MRPPNLSHRVFLFVFSSYKNTVSQKTNGIKIFIYCSTRNIFVCNHPLSEDCLLPALVPDQKSVGHRTPACQSASLWIMSSSARQTAHLSASMSTTATKHLPSCVHKAGLSFAKILSWDGQQRRLFSLS